MTNQVTYVITLTPENASKIDAINRIVLGTAYTSVESKVVVTEIEKEATKVPVKNTPATKAKAEPKAEESTGATLDDVKNAAKKAKADHGEDFAMEVLKAAGVDVAATLGRTMAKIDEDMYDAIIALGLKDLK
jgi:anion-transporting  ArsA/GET3 family ATPase